jgi:hypothetical protein
MPVFSFGFYYLSFVSTALPSTEATAVQDFCLAMGATKPSSWNCSYAAFACPYQFAGIACSDTQLQPYSTVTSLYAKKLPDPSAKF